MLDLVTIKKHLRLEPDYDDENDELELFAGDAKRHVEKYTDRNLYATDQQAGYAEDPTALLLDDDIIVAMLLYIADAYEHRQTMTAGVSIYTTRAIEIRLWPHRRLGV